MRRVIWVCALAIFLALNLGAFAPTASAAGSHGAIAVVNRASVGGDCTGDCTGNVRGDCTGDCVGIVGGDCTGDCSAPQQPAAAPAAAPAPAPAPVVVSLPVTGVGTPPGYGLPWWTAVALALLGLVGLGGLARRRA